MVQFFFSLFLGLVTLVGIVLLVRPLRRIFVSSPPIEILSENPATGVAN